MLTDANKGITAITYNHLNLPTKVTFAADKYISYFYDATGVKLEKVVTEGTAITRTKYAGNFIYNKIGTAADVLQFFNQPEGYVEPNGSAFNYVYQYKDHLGNIRLSYKDISLTSTPSLQIVEENNYYPFGLKHKGYNTAKNGVHHKFEFQGQESQEELDLNWISFKYRNHDPALGRFFNIDPLAEDYSYQSPYNFSENRVVDAIELEGLEKLDYRKVFNSGVNKVNSSVNRVVNNNTYGESQRQMALSQTTNSQQINDIKQSGTDESMLALKEFNEGSSGVARGGSVIVGDGLDDVGSSISKFGYAAAPFTEGASLSLVPIGDGMTGIGKSMKITVYAIDGDTDAVKQEGGEMIFNYGVSKLVSKAVTTTKSLENVTPKELNITEGILGTVGSWFSDAWKTITGGDE